MTLPADEAAGRRGGGGGGPPAAPPELLSTPAALVGFTGLDPALPLHQHIIEVFTSNRGLDRHAIYFCVFPFSDQMEFPVAKPKRTSYEWYMPKGLLKKNWMDKHLRRLPAVMAVFMELDWGDAQFAEKKAECARKVQTVRLALQGRSTKLAVVLLQKQSAGEDSKGAEGATSLCTECQLSTRSLFVLPLNDQLPAAVLRLETAMHEMAQNYYHSEIKNVRSHRELLNKSTQLYLFVRHQFKLGFLNELKGDFHSAYKAYQSAYSFLMEVRYTEANVMEVKTVGGFISYKVCRLAFRLNLPRDAIDQFKRHLDNFRARTGPPELGWEHAGWQSMQCKLFADMFQDAVRAGLPAVQTRHPGIYYQLAADYAVSRRKLAEELCSQALAYPDPDPLKNEESMEFYGQRAWRPGKVTIEPPDLQREKEGMEALQYRERTKTVHSAIILRLLESAIAQFQAFKCPRTTTQLTVQMAEEQMAGHEYTAALSTLAPCLARYRAEQWPRLRATVLLQALKCAYLSCSLASYLTLCLEASAPGALEAEDRKRVWLNLGLLLGTSTGESAPPWPEPSLTGKGERASVGQAAKKWIEAAASGGSFTVEVADFNPGLEPVVEMPEELAAGETLTVTLRIINHGATDVVVRDIHCILKNSAYDKYCRADKEVKIEAGDEESCVFQFVPNSEDVGKEVSVSEVRVTIGSQPFSVQIKRVLSEPADSQLQSSPDPFAFSSRSSKRSTSSTTVVPRRSNVVVSLEHEPPALVGEWFPVAVRLTNREAGPATALEFSAWLRDGGDPLVADTTSLSLDWSLPPVTTPTTPDGSRDFTVTQQPIQKRLGNLEAGESVLAKFFIQSSTEGERAVVMMMRYSVLAGGKSCACSKQETVSLQVVNPFAFDFSILTLQLRETKQVNADEPFLCESTVKYTGPHPLLVVDTKLEARGPVTVQEASSSLVGTVLQELTNASQGFPMVIQEKLLLSQLDSQSIGLGKLTLTWRRKNSQEDDSTAETIFDLPSIKVSRAPVFARCSFPSYGVLRSPMTASYTIYNRTNRVLEMSLAAEPSDAFMFSGSKLLKFKLLPSDAYCLVYTLYPLLAGRVPLPKLKVVSEGERVEEILDRLLPSHITIIPCGSGKKVIKETEAFSVTEPVVLVNEPFTSIFKKAVKG